MIFMHKFFKKNSSIFLLFFIHLAYGQSNYYLPQNPDSLFSYLNNTTQFQIDQLNGEYINQKKKFYKSRLEIITEELNDSNYVFVPELKTQFNNILNNIYTGNPELKKYNFYFLYDRSVIPNAFSLGDGIFIVNIGLLNFLESDDEIAFVICHEIAHFLNNDMENRLDKVLNALNSKETKEKVKEIKREKYGQTNAGIKLYKALSYDLFDYSRENELKADELGYKLMKNTIYNPDISIQTLKKLGQLEEIILSDSIPIESVFEFENYPFKKSWITKEQTLFSVKESINDYGFDKDSIRTHPFAHERVENLKNLFQIDSLHISQDKSNIEKLKLTTKPVIYKTLLDHQNFDLLLYYLIKNDFDNQNSLNYDLLGESIIYLYNAKLKHSLGKGVPQVNPFSKENNINQIRLFIAKTELFEISKIGYNFAEKFKPHLSIRTYNEMIKKFDQ
jgi:Zn-dependent protease with chaperone function